MGSVNRALFKTIYVMKTNKSSDNFKAVLMGKLTEIAARDPLFAKSFEKENKNIQGCISYILSEVQKSGIMGFTDDEVFGMAMHYYDQDEIKDSAAPNCHIIINQKVRLTPEEIEAEKEKARLAVFNEVRNKMTRKNTPSTKSIVVPQKSLFDETTE